MGLPELLEVFAKSRGCPRAIPHRNPYDFSSTKCHVKYRIAGPVYRRLDADGRVRSAGQ